LTFADSNEDIVRVLVEGLEIAALTGVAEGYGTTTVAIDLDGDGFDELVAVSRGGASTGTVYPDARLFVHRGSAAGLEATPSIGLVTRNEGWGDSLALAVLGDDYNVICSDSLKESAGQYDGMSKSSSSRKKSKSSGSSSSSSSSSDSDSDSGSGSV
jgi:hypothetical protein